MKAIKEDEREAPSFEDVLEELGATGRFQMIHIGCCYLSMIFLGFVFMSFVFLGFEPQHVCNTLNDTNLLSTYGLQNDSTAQVVYRSCDIQISANQSGKISEVDTMSCPEGRNFGDAKHTTFLSEWDLVCESSGVAELSQTIFTVGQIVGAFVGSYIADRFGRKPVFIGCSFLACIAESCILAAPNIFVVYGLKLASGMFFNALLCCYFVYATEFVTPKHREINGVVMCVFWVFCVLAVGGVAYFLQNDSWRYLQIAIGVSGLCCLVYPFVLDESPRWLAANDKMEEALRVLKKASKTNGKDFQRVKEAFNAYVAHAFPYSKYNALPMIGNTEDFDVNNFQGGNGGMKKPTMLTLLRVKALRKRTFIAWFLFTTNVITYIGLYMTSSNVAGNRFLNFTLMTVVEIPSNICILFMMKRMGRRLVMGTFFGLAALSLMTSALITSFAPASDASATATTVLFIFGKFAITSSFNVIFIVAPELYPTNLRSTATGLCNGLAKVGSMVAPFLRPLYTVVNWGPPLIFTVMCVIAVVLTIMLPETKGENLPDTFADVEKVPKKKSVLLEGNTSFKKD